MSIFNRYAERLPAVAEEFRCTLGEGNTPLVASRTIGPALGLEKLFFKCEHQNPTGSYKDRFLAQELSLLRQSGAKFVCGTSSGNTGSSLAAFAARYDMPCFLFVCEKTPAGKLLQMRAHGARVFRIKDFCVSREVSAQVMDSLSALAKEHGTRATVSAFAYAPEGMQGVQTISYEIVDGLAELGLGAAHVFAPGGGCGLYLAIARGFLDLGNTIRVSMEGARKELRFRIPAQSSATKVHIVQPRLNDTVVTPLTEGESEARASATTTTISGLAVPQVIDGNEAIAAARTTGGQGFLIEDDDARYWQKALLLKEGIWVEPAGAVALAGLALAARADIIEKNEPVVCVLTGHGFKDPSSAEASCPPEEDMIEAGDLARVMKL